MKRTLIFAGLLGIVSFLALSPRPEPLIQAAAQALPKAVMIMSAGEGGTFLGSGVFISSKGHILTCGHLFHPGETPVVTVTLHNGESYSAEVLAVDHRRDLGLVKIEPRSSVSFAAVADPRGLRVGQSVFAIGYPLGLDFSVCHGIISALNRDFQFAYNVTQSDAMINPGNSGGPLFNMKGELVGINSFIIPVLPVPINSGLGFSVQPGQMIEFLAKFRRQYEGLENAGKLR